MKARHVIAELLCCAAVGCVVPAVVCICWGLTQSPEGHLIPPEWLQELAVRAAIAAPVIGLVGFALAPIHILEKIPDFKEPK